ATCPVPTNAAAAACTNGTCDFTCKTGFHKCGTRCASDTDATACGLTCTVCPTNMPVCSSGSCVARGHGPACGSGAECPTGTRIDGVGCDKSCTGQCQACDVNGAVGTCTPVPANGSPHGTRAACGAAPCAGACDGTTTTSCHYAANQCRAQSCSSGI